MTSKRFVVFGLVTLFVLAMLGVYTPAQASGSVLRSTATIVTFDNSMCQESWGVINATRSVSIEQLGGGKFLVTFVDNGTITTLGTHSPGGDCKTTFVSAGVVAKWVGGQRVVVTGVLKNPFPANVTVDYRNDHRPFKYFLAWFDSVSSADYQDWGWKSVTCGNGTWTDNDATESSWTGVANSFMGDITGKPAACQNPSRFEPGDDRQNGQAGDRIAVYFRNVSGDRDQEIVVYGVDDQSQGFYLTTFSRNQVKAAGAKGVFHDLGKLGIVSVSEATPGNFWVAWNGGPFGAWGQKEWAKAFHHN